jgi:hypothetical protein
MFTPSRRTRLVALALVALLIVGLSLHLRERSSGSLPHALPGSRSNVAGVTQSGPAVMTAANAVQSTASTLPVPALFAYVQPANVAQLDAVLRAPTHRIHYVKLDAALIDGKQSPFWQRPDQGRVVLPLPDGGALTVAIHGSEMLGAQRFTSTGTIEGRPRSRAIFGYSGGFLHALIEDPELGSYELRAGDSELEQFYQVDPALVPPCGGSPHLVPDADMVAEAARRAAQARTPGSADGAPEEVAPVASADSVGANVVVHLMMLYTQGIRANFSGSQRVAVIQSDFDTVVAQVNDDFARSLISARVKLVKIAEVSYPGDEVDPDPDGTVNWQSDMLTALSKSSDTGTRAMNEIHALRDQVGADLVSLIQYRFDSSSAGIGYVMEDPGDNLNSFSGFSVVNESYLGATHTFSHELGHNFGNAHARGDDQSTGTKDGAYTYSYGYRFTGVNGRTYHDIMAYDPGTRLPYFSNPDVMAPSPASAPLGVAVGVAGQEADAALTIDQSAFEVSNYRLQTQTVTNAGTLVNVSTRAFVGTGEQQMIGGFVVNGAAPKKMLVRVAGPALTPFGVAGVLPDPKITLNRIDVSTGNPVAINATGWETQTGGSSGVTAADIVNAVPGAFAFAHGSKDAALLLTLQPGVYTANIESVSNTTGVALIEAYEVDRNNNKLTNLSTRAYVTKDSPIFGGFVVQGDPGTTKRILIRSQGPSLAKFGIAAPLDDPVMYLFNSNSELLMTNDDWDVNAGNTGGSPDDSKPIPTYYSEKQISNTGLAPANRREPCIMIDLPPGLYSAVVRPYSSSSQPATPGVTIIEVFEINP